MKYHVTDARVISQEKTAEGQYLLILHCPDIAWEAQAGQFVHIRCSPGYDPLLRRPLSICLARPEEGLLYLWYQVVGKGTELLKELLAGEKLDIMGPLGRGFETGQRGRNIVLIGGGMGIAPLIFLGYTLAQGNEITAFFGARSGEHLPPPGLWPDNFPYQTATDDGSAGYRGLVTDILPPWRAGDKPDIIYACGPHAMLVRVADMAHRLDIPLQVSLETAMACGVGACLGCTCQEAGGVEGGWLKVCQDGPVFWSREVKWE